jgi:hypothetical protein
MAARNQNATSQPDVTAGVQHLFKAVYAGATSGTKAGVSPEKLLTLAAWYEDQRFDDAERAALTLTEAATPAQRPARRGPDEIWPEATRHYDDRQLEHGRDARVADSGCGW